MLAKGWSQKPTFQANQDSDRLNNGFELKLLSANLTLSGPKLPNLQMIIFVFDRFRAFFLGPVLFCTPGSVARDTEREAKTKTDRRGLREVGLGGTEQTI